MTDNKKTDYFFLSFSFFILQVFFYIAVLYCQSLLRSPVSASLAEWLVPCVKGWNSQVRTPAVFFGQSLKIIIKFTTVVKKSTIYNGCKKVNNLQPL